MDFISAARLPELVGQVIFGLSSAALLSAVVSPASAEELPTYTIHRAGTPITVDGRLDEPAWAAAPDVGPFRFPWWVSGKKEQTVAKLLYDDENLYVAYICEDAHIWAESVHRDGAVSADDCVEIFVAPNPDRPLAYFNIEMNVLGVFLDQFHPEGPGVPVKEEWNGKGIRIATSRVGTLNDDSDEDDHWILEAAIPLQNYAPVARHIPPKPGDVWHVGLNRCGGKTNPQYSQWSPSNTPKPSFHVPECFGRMIFSERSSPFWRE
ncbi:MAG: hypothetical protein EXS64_02835 [Candidatus Latescibacteria bacterium]|nr:hypothetical protein [Candidatus Latescibacterota bacterium]